MTGFLVLHHFGDHEITAHCVIDLELATIRGQQDDLSCMQDGD